ncbi:oxidoreductase ASCRUDRAFT_75772 [Ascoidea rubescens DSM 1968]|uniref:Putative secreted protein n=1 Tax=Ascoidea rubescens DSM 1968 TaxID=1344418 RepID=A0A1D2VHQ5_9ASCO|nr:putative secreted protein [Ascoidea rubescens DSM 1968]ODV61033.1 putative secreted protein [Ascoidea rubescens DSM 1968]
MSYGSQAAKRLADKVIFITGASSGIGQATAREFASAANGQIKLVLSARRLDRLKSLSDELTSSYKNISVYYNVLDVSKIASIPVFIDSLPSEFKEIDILINNAGKAIGVDKVGSIKQDDINDMFQTNVLGMIQVVQSILPGMIERKRGDIVQLGSIAGREPYPGGAIYCATKHSLRAFTSALRKEVVNSPVRIIEIQPGAVETEFSKVRYYGDEKAAKKVYEGGEPLVAEDIAELIVFSCSRRANTVIAETLVFPTCQASPFHYYRGKGN